MQLGVFREESYFDKLKVKKSKAAEEQATAAEEQDEEHAAVTGEKQPAESAETYLTRHNIFAVYEALTAAIMLDRPDDHIDYISNKLRQLEKINHVEQIMTETLVNKLIAHQHPEQRLIHRDLIQPPPPVDSNWKLIPHGTAAYNASASTVSSVDMKNKSLHRECQILMNAAKDYGMIPDSKENEIQQMVDDLMSSLSRNSLACSPVSTASRYSQAPSVQVAVSERSHYVQAQP